jgi:hypothetical protein
MVARTYRWLLGLYPADFQEDFGGEMFTVFEQAAAPRGLGYVVFVAKELAGRVAGAFGKRTREAESADLPFPSDIAGAERYSRIVSRWIVPAIAHHDFDSARYYDLQDRRARALLAQLRG